MPSYSPLSLTSRIAEVRRNELRIELTSGLLLNGAIWLAAALLLVLLEVAVGFSPVVRTAMVAGGLLLATASLIWLVLRPWLKMLRLLRTDDDETIARRIGAAFPTIQDRLLNVLQLTSARDQDRPLYSEELVRESVRALEEQTSAFDFTDCVDTRPLPRAARWFTLCALVVSAFLVVSPAQLADSIYRLAHPTRPFAPMPRFAIEVVPRGGEVLKGDTVRLRVRLVPVARMLGSFPSEIALFRRAEGQSSFEESALQEDSAGRYAATLASIRSTTEYFVRAGSVESDRYTLRVLDRPLIRSFTVRLEPPSYTKLPVRQQDEFVGDIQALVGTRVTVSGTSNKPLTRAEIVLDDSTHVRLAEREEKFSGSFVIRKSCRYAIVLTDADALTNPDPVRYQISAVEDQLPEIAIIVPGRDLDVAGDTDIPLRLRATDDHGFTRLRLGSRLIHSRLEQPTGETSYVAIPLPANAGARAEIDFTWSIAAMHLAPEDVVEYFAEVEDNDTFSGPKRSRSRTFRIRFPSLEEVFAGADQTQQRSMEEIGKALEEAKKLKEDVDAINRELKMAKNPDWQTQKKLEEMGKRYQDLQKQIDRVQERMDQLTQQMQQQSVLSSETMEKYLELQQMFQELNSAELQKLLKQMQQTMPNVTKEQMRQAMEQVTFNEERFRESIERTLNLLKRIQIEQKMDEVRKRADALEKAQKELEEHAGRMSDPAEREEAARRQEELAKAEQLLEREAQDLQQRMEEFFTEMPADKMQELNEQLQQQNLDQQMQQAGEQMRRGNMSAARQMQQQVAQQLQQFSMQMDAMQQEMMQQQAQAVLNELRKATYGLLELSRRQEELKRQASAAPQNSPTLRENAQGQQQLTRELQSLIEGLNELSQKSFAVTPEMGRAIGEALARMNNAMKRLEMRNGPYAAQEQAQAMAALNRAAMQVQNAMANMMQSGGGAGSLMQQLRMMAGQQMSLNMQTQQMGQGMSPRQAAEAARLAREQEALRKSLEQLQKEAGTQSDRERVLGDLNKIAEEMQEVVRNLEQNDVNPETLRKQERILSRLLDASRSMRERDFEKKRKAETGKPVIRKSPSELDQDNLGETDRLRNDLLKAMEQGYSKDFQELIRKYFEELRKLE